MNLVLPSSIMQLSTYDITMLGSGQIGHKVSP